MQNSISLPAIALIVALAGLIIALLLFRMKRNARMSSSNAAKSHSSRPVVRNSSCENSFTIHRHAIVDQLDNIDHTNRKQMQTIMAVMLESSNWQALGQQFDSLVDKRLEHLRALANRHNGLVTCEEALHHTTEAYRLSRLILSLYDEFVAQSDVVTRILDDWFVARRGMTTSEFGTSIHVDCARILLLDLDYAKPSYPTTLTQLNLAEKHCADAPLANTQKPSLCESLLSEIDIRKERLA